MKSGRPCEGTIWLLRQMAGHLDFGEMRPIDEAAPSCASHSSRFQDRFVPVSKINKDQVKPLSLKNGPFRPLIFFRAYGTAFAEVNTNRSSE